MSIERAYRDVSASTAADLASRIETALQQLEERPDVKHMWLVSVSHTVGASSSGNAWWTAFITCEIEIHD